MTTRCKRCGKPLYKPENVECGYGPACWKKHIAEIVLSDNDGIREENIDSNVSITHH